MSGLPADPGGRARYAGADAAVRVFRTTQPLRFARTQLRVTHGFASSLFEPGAFGPVGHVTWNRAPAGFHRLGTMRRGDQVTVTREDEKTAVFTVSRVARFSKSRFPSQAVYGAIDHAGLRRITCGGTYDAARHKYLDNIVVFATLEAVRGPGG